MTIGPIRVKQVNQSSAVIDHIDELADETLAGRPPSRHVKGWLNKNLTKKIYI